MSVDGRFVFFLSNARGLTTNESTGALNLFRRDLFNGETALASVAINGAAANRACYGYAVSSNGQVVAFTSAASNLFGKATNGAENIFIRDFETERTLLVSANANEEGGNYSSLNPQLTPDGKYVVFQSLAKDLVDGDTNGICDVFLRDVEVGRTVLVSTNAVARDALSYSSDPSVTTDGQRVAFVSTAMLDPTTDPGRWIAMRDMIAGTTEILKATGLTNNFRIPPTLGGSGVLDVVLSANGEALAFEAVNKVMLEGETNGVRGIYYGKWQDETLLRVSTLPEFYELPSPSSRAATNVASRPTLSRDGRFVVFHAGLGVFPTVPGRLYQWDVETRSNQCVSVSDDGVTPANGTSFNPQISADNRYITFLSNATNLVENATNRTFQVYQRDLASVVSRKRLELFSLVFVSSRTSATGFNSFQRLFAAT